VSSVRRSRDLPLRYGPGEGVDEHVGERVGAVSGCLVHNLHPAEHIFQSFYTDGTHRAVTTQTSATEEQEVGE